MVLTIGLCVWFVYLLFSCFAQLNGNEFTDLVALNELHLGQNYLDFIPERTFKNLASLKKLYLFSNNIQKLDVDSFYGLKNLSSLFLNNNILKIIDYKLFEPIRNLRKLWVAYSSCKQLWQIITIYNYNVIA